MDNVIISIIIPIYNVEEYLIQCLDSVKNQSFKNFEALLIDDGSIDSSAKICKDYTNKDSRFKYFYKQNGGLSDARNYGIKRSKGNYLSFLDSDDFIDEDYLLVLYKGLLSTGADISVVNYRRIDDHGHVYSELENKIDQKLTKIEVLEKLFYQTDISISATAKLYKKELFSNILFPKGLLYEDIYTVPRLILSAEKVYCSSKTLLNYRIRSGSITQSQYKDKDIDMLNNSLEIYDFVMKQISEFNENSLKSYIFSKSSTLIFLIENSNLSKNKKREKQLLPWNYIKENRKSILFDKNARFVNRIGSFISFFGISVFLLAHKFK